MNIFKVSLPRFMILFLINITLQRDVNVLLFNFADGNELLMLSRSYCTWCKCDENIFTWYCSILLMAIMQVKIPFFLTVPLLQGLESEFV